MPFMEGVALAKGLATAGGTIAEGITAAEVADGAMAVGKVALAGKTVISTIREGVQLKNDIAESRIGEGKLRELPSVETGRRTVEQPDIAFIERTSRSALIEQCAVKRSDVKAGEGTTEFNAKETKAEGLTEAEKAKIKEETGWSDEIVDNIKNMKQYELLKNAGLVEAEINGKKCLIKENIDLDYTDEDGISNRDRINRGLAPLDSKTGEPLELHHLGQKADSPLVELTKEEHRTGEYEDGKKNQSLWHDNSVETEVHGEGNTWDQERKEYWIARSEMMR